MGTLTLLSILVVALQESGILRLHAIATLPFRLAAVAGPWTPLAVCIVSYTFCGLDALGGAFETQFGFGQNVLPLSAMTRGIEIDILEMLGETTLPDILRPVDFSLT